MASWLRAAEELFEVVDRKAKQAVIRLPEELPFLPQNTGPEQGTLSRLSSTGSVDTGVVRRVSQSSVPTTPSKATPFQENGASGGLSQSDHHSNLLSTLDRADVRNSSLEGKAASGDDVKDLVPQAVESLEFVANAETEEKEKQMAAPGSEREREAHILQGAEVSAAADGDASLKYISLSLQEVDSKHQSPSSEGELAESCGSSHDENDTKQSSVDLLSDQVVSDERVESVECKFRAEENGTVVVDLLTVEKPHVEKPVVPVGPNVDSHGAETEKSTVATVNVLEQQQLPSPVDEKMPLEMPKVEDQLNEARGLLTVAVSSGPSKEARLARVCAGLSSRLQEYKSENLQLEELLQFEREERKSFDARMRQLQQELAAAKESAAAVEAGMVAALASKNAEIDSLSSSVESFKRQASMAEGKLAALQTTVEAMSKNRDMTETRMIQALRNELASAEHRVEEERMAHSATRHAAVERETELEQRMAESNSALMRMQKIVDERNQRVTDMEHKLAMLEVECATLNQELQESQARQRREQKRPNEEAVQTAQVWREEAERARQLQREADSKLSAMEAEMQKLRVELASVKREADLGSLQAQSELEKRFRELTELLYTKQTQLEVMSSEKAAAMLQLEQARRLQAKVQAEAERQRNVRNMSSFEDENELKSFEYLGLHQRRLGPVGPSVQRAAKFLDSSAVTAGRFLWRRPLARLIAVLYLEQADRPSSREELEAAKAAGLLLHGRP
ncbi:hypothetical protein CY35_03G018200 [Sphagnum magellanicum]|nr:hypothetical protein CY35_03G018200 [Sphagnum magellanicum]